MRTVVAVSGLVMGREQEGPLVPHAARTADHIEQRPDELLCAGQVGGINVDPLHLNRQQLL